MLELNIFTSVLLVVIFLILFFRKDNSLPNKILALTLLVPGFNFINNIFILNELIYIFPWSYFFVQITGTLFAPFSYYYILLMTGQRKSRAFPWLSGFTGLIILYGLYITIQFLFMNAGDRSAYMTGVMKGPYPADMIIYSAILFTHQLIYLTANIFQVLRYRKNMMGQYSNLSPAKLNYLFYFVILLWSLTFLTVILYATIETVYVEYIGLPVVMVTIFIFILYYAFNQNAVFNKEEYEHFLEVVRPAIKEENIGENELSQEPMFHKILEVIEVKKLYKNPDLTLEILSGELDTPAYKLTYCIKRNEFTFYELMRKLRVEKARELLTDENCPFTIEAIAYEVGFSSRASFYRAFKKYEGTDPSSLTKQF